MQLSSTEIKIPTEGFSDTRDITSKIQNLVTESQMKEGFVNLFVIGSTASISTIEYEPNLLKDIKERLEGLAPISENYHHHKTWGDDNGFSHVRATIMGPGISAPFSKGKLVLGNWQQIVVIDHDSQPRERRIFIQIFGQ
ncbi:YjbQ family protein [bacterium]|jgi:secondary thiamine-phosphate synthase enzyme|nr:YjbQ family protein [bacterium]